MSRHRAKVPSEVGALIGKGLLALPDLAPVVLLAFGLAGLGTVLIGQFWPWAVLATATLLAVVFLRWLPAPPPTTRSGLLAVGVLLTGCAVWLWWGWQHVAQYVVVNRDPGFLTLQALWLSEHPAAPIPVGGAATAAVAGASAGTEAFWLQDGMLFAQGNKMLPALLAMPGWLGGQTAVLSANLLIGVVALLAVFAAGRRLAGPLWALVPTAALACCLPFLVGTRAAYTEPLALAFFAGGLALALAARRGASIGHTALTGALFGAVATVRIDGAVVVVGLVAGAVVVGLASLRRADRQMAARRTVAFVGPAVMAVALGLVDVLRLSPDYWREHQTQITALLAATTLTVACGLVLLSLPDRWLAVLRLWVYRRRQALGNMVGIGVLLFAVVLASRPLWWQGHFTDPSSGYGIAVQILQAAAGLPSDAARSYDEQTLAWTSWYLGPVAVVMGFVGLAVLARRAVIRRFPGLAVAVAVIAVAVAFPLVRVSITPDQVWAARRLLPAVFPGLLLAAAVPLSALARVGRWVGPRRAVAVGLAAALVAMPVTTWRPGADVVELSGRTAQAAAVCDALAEEGIERVVWTHSSPFRYLATLRVLCDVQAVEFVTAPDRSQLAQVVAAWGEGTVAAASFDVTAYEWTVVPTTSVGGTVSTTLGRSLTGVPDTVDTTWSEVWIGAIQSDGTVTPLRTGNG